MENKIKREKSNIVLRTVVLKNGKEKVVEELLENVNSDSSPISNEKLDELFDSIFTENESL